MSHEQSETIQLPDGSWVNVYGKNTPLAGQILPGTPKYPTLEAAVAGAVARSNPDTRTWAERSAGIRPPQQRESDIDAVLRNNPGVSYDNVLNLQEGFDADVMQRAEANRQREAIVHALIKKR